MFKPRSFILKPQPLTIIVKDQARLLARKDRIRVQCTPKDLGQRITRDRLLRTDKARGKGSFKSDKIYIALQEILSVRHLSMMISVSV